MTEIELMMDAYRQLYEIENKLRLIIRTNLQRRYSIKPPVTLYQVWNEYHTNIGEMIDYFAKHTRLLPHFSVEQRNQIKDLIPIRNKIAHAYLITEDEYHYLKRCHRLVMKQPIVKRRKVESPVMAANNFRI